MMLIQAAADEWKVPAAECSAANSVITHTASGRKVTFGKVADAAAKLDPPKDVPLKDPKTWTIAGKPLKRLDTPDKIVGKPIYGIDIRLPNMLYASIVACPVFGGKVESFDEAKVHDMPGVKKVVKVGDNAVAVVANSWWRAQQGARCHANRLGRGRERQSLQCLDRAMAQGGPRLPTKPSSATSRATPRPRLAAPPR